MTHGPQLDMFAPSRAPVMVAWGAGLDSTAMILKMIEDRDPIDVILFADTGGETPEVYETQRFYAAHFAQYGIPVHTVRYEPTNFKNYPPYSTLEGNCLTNKTLPSLAFGFGSCSAKWKAQPQDKWAKSWLLAQQAWAAGVRVKKCIGYDCSPADNKRYAEAEGYAATDQRYEYRYPLRDYAWTRDDCIAFIKAKGLPVPKKSACFFCPASKPHEIAALPPELLRRIVLMEACAKPRLTSIDGLWRKPVKGVKDPSKARPGSMTEFIRDRKLLDAAEIDAIIASAPKDLVAFADKAGQLAVDQRPTINSWLEHFSSINALAAE